VKKRAGGPNPCLADFILPREAATKEAAETAAGQPFTGQAAGWLGLFALSAGFGLETAEARFKAEHDEYRALLLASLANSLAEAFAEDLHLRVRREFWGYDREGKGGIRPAFGYPACPDHEDKRLAFRLLRAQEHCGLSLTESAMILPAASVCGMYMPHPDAYYFGMGAVGEDQLRDWAARKGIPLEEARRRIGGLL
jgi:5-methyltetrahydrofolate--homocysteine methyltransferase